MKVTKVYYNDDSILVEGHLIERFMRRPIFYPFDPRCGFTCQCISDRSQLVEHKQDSYRKFYRETYPVGTKIRVQQLGEEPMRFPAGTVVFVIKVDDAPNIHCTYGRKNRINLIPGVDTFRIVK